MEGSDTQWAHKIKLLLGLFIFGFNHGDYYKTLGSREGVLSGWNKWLLQLHAPSILNNNDNNKRILSGKVGDGFGLL